MRRTNNKGFSLVELVVAIAVMSILITPIINKLMASLRISARAKESQYAFENAAYVYDYFDKTSKSTLDSGGTSELSINSTAVSNYSCRLYTVKETKSGSNILYSIVDTNKDINYSVTTYNLPSVTIKPKNKTYTRSVDLDDLDNKARTAGYNVIYNVLPDSKNGLGKYVKDNGWNLLDDGKAVKYTDGHISAVLVAKMTNATTDYSMQGLNSNTVALIDGTEANYDKQFATDLRTAMIKIDADAGFTDTATVNSDISQYLAPKGETGETINRYIAISVRTILSTDGKQVDHYHVTVSVYFNCISNFRGKKLPEFSYIAYDKDFYTTESPDVYLIYEPFVIGKGDSSVENYSPNDYIITYGDQYASTGNLPNGAKTDPSKVYLIRPEKTWFNSVSNRASSTIMKSNIYYYKKGGSYNNKVRIHLNEVVDSKTPGTEQLKVYTNVSVTDQGDSIIVGQFAYDNFSSAFVTSNILSSGQSLNKYIGTNNMAIKQDVSNTARLYGITVNMSSDEGTTIHYTGSKEAD